MEYELPEKMIREFEEATTSRIKEQEDYRGGKVSFLVNLVLSNFFPFSDQDRYPWIDRQVVDETKGEDTEPVTYTLEKRWIDAVRKCAYLNNVSESQIVLAALHKYSLGYTEIFRDKID